MSSETVLLVEDDPDVRTCVAEVLRIGGFAVLEAADGEEALRIAETPVRPIEILVTDINMPGIDGLELARHVRALRPAIGVVYKSGESAYVVAGWNFLTGTVFLAKPFSADVLVERVRDAVRRAQFQERAGAPVTPSTMPGGWR